MSFNIPPNIPPPMPNEIFMESAAASKQQDMSKDYARMRRLDKIIAIIVILAIITVMILMNGFHLF